MVSRIGLVVVLAFAAVPAMLMGDTTYFFIDENPYFDDELEAGEAPAMKAAIVEVESDSEVSAPDGYEETDTAYIHSLGLLAPSELALCSGLGVYKDWHTDFWANREWGTGIMTSYIGGYKLVQVLTVTARYTIRGIVSVNDTTISPIIPPNGGWYPGWITKWGARIQWAASWLYDEEDSYSWTQVGRHSWNTGPILRTHVGPIVF
jgi:hypothetical protein